MEEELYDLPHTTTRGTHPASLVETSQAKGDLYLCLVFESNFSKSFTDEVCSLSFGHFRQRIETDVVAPLSEKVWWDRQDWMVL